MGLGEMDIKVVVATHKAYRMPEDEMYVPVLVGAERNDCAAQDYLKDNTGDNISSKNANFCELTGLYWAWKNLEADYIGMVHYRRHFSNGKVVGDKWSRILTKDQVEEYLDMAPVLLPKPRHYYIDTNYGQYAHAHHAEDLDTTRDIIFEKCPEYIPFWDVYMKKTTGHRFNMFVMRRDIFDKYCEWLFDILFELEKRLDISKYSENDARVFGFVGERLLDIWLMKNKVKCLELPYMFMEKQNWLVKGTRFVMRKVGKKGIVL